MNGSGSTSKTITVRAKGAVACSEWPNMELYVNGTISGKDAIDVVFTNDGGSECGGDRNLYVDYVTVDGTTIQAEGGAVLYDRGTGSAAFDWWDTILGQEGMYWSGALRMVRGAGAFVGGTDEGKLREMMAQGRLDMGLVMSPARRYLTAH